MAYSNTPQGILKIISLLKKNRLSYLLFKCDHIFEGQNKNLDILFETDSDYRKAADLLESCGFIVRLSEKVERYKTMYCGLVGKTMCSIHLHREIAWHGMVALDKEKVFGRKQQVHQLIAIPGLEDSILIHAAHIIFENFRITDKERKYLDQIDSATLDKEYIAYQLKKNNWRKAFLKIIRSKDRTENVDLKVIASAWVYKLVKEPGTGVYLAGKSIKKIVRHLNCKRKGALIAVIGVNGSGKSTLTKKLLEAYEPVTKHLGLKQQGYYFGWKPYSFYAKIISARNLKKDNNFFESVNQGKKSGLFRELFFAYNFLEYYWRYLFEVRPALATNGLVVTDRYFYDLYGQYNLAPQSCLIKPLLKIYPRPDYLFVLDAPTEKIMNRAKEQNFSGMSKSPKRVVMDRDYLEKQKQRYYHLVDLLGGVLVNTQKEKNSNVTFMVEKSWKLVVR